MTILQATFRLVRRLLTDPRYFWYLATLVILGDAVLTQLIICFIPYTEIDWETYMIQAQIASKGELNYSNITGPTGPTVYPAGHLYIHRVLHDLTSGGTNVKLAQNIYGALYLALVAVVCGIYRRAGSVPNWMLLMLPLSKRLHSIFVLRLFNDCWSVLAVHAAVFAYQARGMEHFGTLLFSIALSVKMSALLYLPGLLVIMFKRLGPMRTLGHIVVLVFLQYVVGRHYLQAYPWEYLQASFDFSRAFLYKWTVNWRFVSEDTFLSSQWSKGLLLGHLMTLVAFGAFRWCRGVDNLFAVLKRGLRRPTQPAGVAPVTAEEVAITLFTSNLIGMIFARSLHYQFYSWYALQVPFLLSKAPYHLSVRLALWLAIEYSWNVFPSTTVSSGVLLVANILVLCGVWMSPDERDTLQKNNRKGEKLS